MAGVLAVWACLAWAAAQPTYPLQQSVPLDAPGSVVAAREGVVVVVNRTVLNVFAQGGDDGDVVFINSAALSTQHDVRRAVLGPRGSNGALSVYIAMGAGGVHIYEVSAASGKISWQATIVQLGDVRDLALSDDGARLYVASAEFGLATYLVSPPVSPTIDPLMDYLPDARAVVDGEGPNVFVALPTALVVVDREGGNHSVVDLTGALGVLADGGGAPPAVLGVYVSGAVVLVTTTRGIVPLFYASLDSTLPDALTPLPLPTVTAVASAAFASYVTGSDAAAFVAVDWANPERLAQIGSAAPAGDDAATSIAVDAGTAYALTPRGLAVYDVDGGSEEASTDVGQIVGIAVGVVAGLTLGVWIFRLAVTRTDDYRGQIIIEGAKQAVRSSLRAPSARAQEGDGADGAAPPPQEDDALLPQ